jgi:hypothetical protein
VIEKVGKVAGKIDVMESAMMYMMRTDGKWQEGDHDQGLRGRHGYIFLVRR